MVEAWLSGPVEGVHPLLMPAAHAFVQVRNDISGLLDGLSTEQVWTRPGGSAAIGYHALHLAGATDRLLTYARGEQLSPEQLEAASAEKALPPIEPEEIVRRVTAAIDAAIEQIRQTPPETLTDAREVGRRRLPSNVLGLI